MGGADTCLLLLFWSLVKYCVMVTCLLVWAGVASGLEVGLLPGLAGGVTVFSTLLLMFMALLGLGDLDLCCWGHQVVGYTLVRALPCMTLSFSS